jgi:mRNA-degrading endonuclease RelE of RelBE toxin-antitoxin system
LGYSVFTVPDIPLQRTRSVARGSTPAFRGRRRGIENGSRGSVADLWRIRIEAYRVVYPIDDDARLVDIRVVRHRGDAYG